MRSARPTGSRNPRGFTLVELLVVLVIVLLLTAATLPTIIPALNQRKVSAAALILQAELSRIRDAAIRANAPRGIRLVPEQQQVQFAFFDPTQASGFGQTPVYTRMIGIESGPDYHEGLVMSGYPVNFATADALLAEGQKYGDIMPSATFPTGVNRIVVQEAKFTTVMVGQTAVTIPSNPTNWFWNIRRGDKIRFNSSGQTYTIAGPVLLPNSEGFINFGPPSPPYSQLSNTNAEFLFLVNGTDDNSDGYTDEAVDGIDNDQDGFIDPGYNSHDDNGNGLIDETAELALGPLPPNPTTFNYNYGEYEQEAFMNPPGAVGIPYTIYRRPVPSPGAREIALPTGVGIDMTSWDASLFSTPTQTHVPERSRLPVDPLTGYIEVMVSPNGQVIQAGATSGTSQAPPANMPFYHFWIADLDDIYEPVATTGVPYLLPMPGGSNSFPNANDGTRRVLKGERRLVSLNTRSGQLTTTTPDLFDATSILTLDFPYLKAQGGMKEQP